MKNLTDKQSLTDKPGLRPKDLGLKRKNLEQLKVELEEFEKVKLPRAMKKFGTAIGKVENGRKIQIYPWQMTKLQFWLL